MRFSAYFAGLLGLRTTCKTKFLFVLLASSVLLVEAGAAAGRNPQPTMAEVNDEKVLLSFPRYGCPPRERPALWLGVVENKQAKRSHRLVALSYLILRHGQHQSFDTLMAWSHRAGLTDRDWYQVRFLTGVIPLRKIDLSAGIFRAGFRLRHQLDISLSVQFDSRTHRVADAVAVVFAGDAPPEIIRSCQ